jgi:hypothetical protein
MLLHLLDEALPFIRLFISSTGSFLSSDDDELGEPILLGENPFWQEVFTLLDHLQLCLVNKKEFLLHAVLIALTDDCNDKIHKYNVSDNQNEHPEDPYHYFEVFAVLN